MRGLLATTFVVLLASGTFSHADSLNPEYISCWKGPKAEDFCDSPQPGHYYDALFIGCSVSPTAMGPAICTMHRPTGNESTRFDSSDIDSGGGGTCGWHRFKITCHLSEGPIGEANIPNGEMTPEDTVAKNFCRNLKPHGSQTYRVWPADAGGGGAHGHLTLHVVCYADK
jgi:hypothetical protein